MSKNGKPHSFQRISVYFLTVLFYINNYYKLFMEINIKYFFEQGMIYRCFQIYNNPDYPILKHWTRLRSAARKPSTFFARAQLYLKNK